MITIEQIQAAQNNELDGISAVLAEMDERINRLASQTASSMGTNPARYSDYVNDFRQDAMVSLFEYLPRWTGNSPDAFCAYLYSAIAGDLKAKLHAERNAGVDRDALSVFKAMVAQADGDVFLAEKMAQTVPPKGKRISADRAYAARIAWQGSVSIDKSDSDDGASIADMLAEKGSVDQHQATLEIRPKVGTGAALEALAVLQRYGTDPRVLNALPASAEGVDAIEDAVKVPREASARKAVLDAVAILRSYVSTATDGELADDLRDASDDQRDERAVKVANVRAALNKLGDGQRMVLLHSFGILGLRDYGWGDSGDLEGLAEELETTPKLVRDRRNKGRNAFAKYYIEIAARDAAEARALTAAAEACNGRGSRK